MSIKSESSNRNGLSIVRICVEELFGQYTYDLRLETEDHSLLIIYGDNGTGKTTILNLTFHLLSPEDSRGHRSFLAKTLFRRFEVQLENGTRVLAKRSIGKLDGPYSLQIFEGETLVHGIDIEVGEDNIVREQPEKKGKQLRALLTCLSKLNVAIHFLSDDRKVWSDIYAGEDEEMPAPPSTIVKRDLISSDLVSGRIRDWVLSTGEPSRSQEFVVTRAISRAVQRINQQALRGSNLGVVNTNNIYTDIVKRIASSPLDMSDVDEAPETQRLISTLRREATRSEGFSDFGLTSPPPAEELVAILKTARHETLPIIHRILQPYIDGIEARLDALQETQDLIATFVGNINRFYTNKTVRFHLQRGLTIHAPDGTLLSPSILSSGEKQLLLLFCNTLSAQDQASIFIIDEPEISLNVKWQRHLIQALLDCVRGGNVQFVLATHSLELLARHRENVVKLNSRGRVSNLRTED